MTSLFVNHFHFCHLPWLILPTNLVVWTNFWQFLFIVVAYILLYPMYKLFFKFEIVCMLHCQVMEDFIKLPPYLHDLYSWKKFRLVCSAMNFLQKWQLNSWTGNNNNVQNIVKDTRSLRRLRNKKNDFTFCQSLSLLPSSLADITHKFGGMDQFLAIFVYCCCLYSSISYVQVVLQI